MIPTAAATPNPKSAAPTGKLKVKSILKVFVATTDTTKESNIPSTIPRNFLGILFLRIARAMEGPLPN